MASVGHFITLLGVVFFFLMLIDSHVEKRLAIPSTLGLPRWHKRAGYYIFKICYLNMMTKLLSKMPGYRLRRSLTRVYDNAYEKVKRVYILRFGTPA